MGILDKPKDLGDKGCGVAAKQVSSALNGVKNEIDDVLGDVSGDIKSVMTSATSSVSKYITNLPQTVYNKTIRPLLQKLSWLFSWIKPLVMCSCSLYLFSACMAMGIPQLLIGVIQTLGRGSAQSGNAPSNNLPTSMAMFDQPDDNNNTNNNNSNNYNNNNSNNYNNNNNAGNAGYTGKLRMNVPNFSQNDLKRR